MNVLKPPKSSANVIADHELLKVVADAVTNYKDRAEKFSKCSKSISAVGCDSSSSSSGSSKSVTESKQKVNKLPAQVEQIQSDLLKKDQTMAQLQSDMAELKNLVCQSLKMNNAAQSRLSQTHNSPAMMNHVQSQYPLNPYAPSFPNKQSQPKPRTYRKCTNCFQKKVPRCSHCFSCGLGDHMDRDCPNKKKSGF